MAVSLRYGLWEHLPVVFTTTEAWVLSTKTDKWETLHPAEAMCKAGLMTKAEFEAQCPDAPKLPKAAFR